MFASLPTTLSVTDPENENIVTFISKKSEKIADCTMAMILARYQEANNLRLVMNDTRRLLSRMSNRDSRDSLLGIARTLELDDFTIDPDEKTSTLLEDTFRVSWSSSCSSPLVIDKDKVLAVSFSTRKCLLTSWTIDPRRKPPALAVARRIAMAIGMLKIVLVASRIIKKTIGYFIVKNKEWSDESLRVSTCALRRHGGVIQIRTWGVFIGKQAEPHGLSF